MAIRFQIRNTTTATLLAQRDITNDAAIDDIREVFPGTPAQAADAVLVWMLQQLREYIRQQIRQNAGNAALVPVQTATASMLAAEDTREATLNTNWPVT